METKGGQAQGPQQQRLRQEHGDQGGQALGPQQQRLRQEHGDQGGQALGPQQQRLRQEHGDQGGQALGPQQQRLRQDHGDQGGQAQGPQQQRLRQDHGDQGGQAQGPQQQRLRQEHGDQGGQLLGPQDQKQKQQHGDQGQTLEPQVQNQEHGDQGQTLEPQVQNQEHGDQGQILGPQLQNQEHGDQEQGPQIIDGHTNTSPLNNAQSIDTSVSGVTVNVTTNCKSDMECSAKDECDECDDCERKGRKCKMDRKSKKNKRKGLCEKDCDCCTQALSDLLDEIRISQQADISGNPIDIYLTTPQMDGPVTPPVGSPGWTITNVVECSTVTFKDAVQDAVIPNTTTQLCKVAGISADSTATTPEFFQFLLDLANTCDSDSDLDCDCDCCANGIGEGLACTTRFGIEVDVNIEGQDSPIEELFVKSICDCLVFFVDDLNDPTVIYVFTLCSVTGYTVPTQSLG
ncbi:hypothetical protein LC065_13255 [Halobacillus litoralis]|uniref:hypothetical protein n=1 Tax=Halobacillus litoralis TaxID=45668 RepID=UPI00273D04CD|nr:hypothetical protein [Halobacillus litoralis]WLR46535.1 hypothetical protein LC065_13255 [Halobacillus litoralis]